jgi:hypothetical protein
VRNIDLHSFGSEDEASEVLADDDVGVTRNLSLPALMMSKLVLIAAPTMIQTMKF